MDIKKTVGQKIKEARLKSALTQEQLGNLIGTSKQNISSIESGKENLTIETLDKISGALKRKPRDFMP